jgi:hypothetical protein
MYKSVNNDITHEPVQVDAPAYEQYLHKELTIEGQRCVIARDMFAFHVLRHGTDIRLSSNDDEQKAIQLAAQALRCA